MSFLNWIGYTVNSIKVAIAAYPKVQAYLGYGASMAAMAGAVVNNYSNPLLNGLSTATIAATSGAGLKWSGIIGGITIADDLITKTGITKNHYLSNMGTALGLLYHSHVLNAASKPIQAAIVAGITGITAAAIYFLNYDVVKPYRDVTLGVYTNYVELSELFPDPEFKSSINSFLMLTLAVQVIHETFTRTISNEYNTQLSNWWHAITNDPIHANQQIMNGQNIATGFLLSSALNIVLNYATRLVMDSYYLTMSNQINQHIIDHVFTEDNIFKIVYNDNAINLIKGIHESSSSVAQYSASNLISGVGEVISGLAGIALLSTNCPTSMLSLAVFSNLIQVWRAGVTEDSREAYFQRDAIERNIDNRIYDISHNMRQIAERGGIPYVKKNLLTKIDALHEARSSGTKSDSMQTAIATMDDRLSYFITYGLGSYFHYYSIADAFANMPNHALNLEEIAQLDAQVTQAIRRSYDAVYGIGKLQSFLTWSHTNSNEYKVAMTKLSQIMKIIQEESKNNFNMIEHDNPYLHLEDIKIDVVDRNLIDQSKPVDLPMGAKIEVSGPSGSGKSTMLTILKKIQSIPFINGSGTISYPKIDGNSIKTIMVTQSEYMTPQTSLLNVIAFPFQMKNAERPFIKMAAYKILAQLEGRDYHEHQADVDANSMLHRLDEEQYDWGNALSGGQKKKISCASAVLQAMSSKIVELMKAHHDDMSIYEQKLNEFLDYPIGITPHIIEFDEPLNGMDWFSALCAMRVIQKYFYNSLVIVVDHNSKEHNHIMQEAFGYNFFDAIMTLVDHDIHLTKFGTKDDFVTSDFIAQSWYGREHKDFKNQSEQFPEDGIDADGLCSALDDGRGHEMAQDYCYIEVN